MTQRNITLPTAAVQALEDLRTHAQIISGPDARAQVRDKLRQLQNALRIIAGENESLQVQNRDVYLQNVYLGLQHEKLVKELAAAKADAEREKKEKQQALGMRDSLLEVVAELKAALEAEKRKSLEQCQLGEAQDGLHQMKI